MPRSVPAAREMFSDLEGKATSKLVERREELVKAMTKATVDGLSGNTYFSGSHDSGAPVIKSRSDLRSTIGRELSDANLAKSVDPSVMAALNAQLTGGKTELLSKEWTLSNPISTGLVPFDLEAPAKLLAPRPTPLRNAIPRVKGQGAARRYKVISGFTGTGTGGISTMQPGFTEGSTSVGPGGLSYIRPPYIQYAGYDVVQSYVSYGLSDSVSWQAEFQGTGFEDIRSLSNTALLYSTMLLEERLMLYGRGTTGNGYAGALGTPTFTVASCPASVTPLGITGGSTSLGAQTYWVVIAADAGDLLNTNGSMHQGPTTSAASVASASGGGIQVSISADAAGALGYNMFVASASAGPFFYAGRTGYNVGFITSAPTNTASVSASASDASAVATNFDGLLTNLAASGGYVKRLNATFSTSTPGSEFQNAFSSLYDSVKASPEEIWLNGHDRNQLSNALVGASNVNAYRITVPDSAIDGVRVGAVVQSLVNQITGDEVGVKVHPWLPQGNAIVRSVSLPIPDSNVAETSVMACVQDYLGIQWPATQFTYDSSSIIIGVMCHYAPAFSGLLQGIQLNG